MRVAVLNRDRSTHPGGDLVQIDATIEALRRRGIDAVYGPAILRGFDLTHVFHVNFGWSRENFDAVRRAGIPYVVTPIFYPSDAHGASRDEMRGWLAGAECVMPHSRWELREIAEVTGLGAVRRLALIPNGTAPMFHGFDQHDGAMDRDLVIAIAARKGDKNTEVVQRECNRMNIRFATLLGFDHAQVARILTSRCRVFVNASGSERMSLTIGEALCAGARVLATDQNRGNWWYGPGLRTIPCGGAGGPDATRLRGALAEAYWASDAEWDYSPNVAARALTWDSVAEQLEAVYRGAFG